MRILVTGAFGWTAQSIIEKLYQEGYDIISFDLPSASCPQLVKDYSKEIIKGDVSNTRDVAKAINKVDVIIHLAVAVDIDYYENIDIPFKVNVQGTYNVFEAAKQSNIQKIILISSAPVHIPMEKDGKLDAVKDWVSCSGGDHLYDLTKHLQEEIARDYCNTYNTNAIVLRAGHIVDGRREVDPKNRPLSEIDYCRGGWVCRYDLAEACIKSLNYNNKGYDAFHIIGALDAEKNFDIERTKEVLGLKFENRFKEYK